MNPQLLSMLISERDAEIRRAMRRSPRRRTISLRSAR
jgi:hypothetical protein